jgi:MFS-type transporter involved in bile tolerance (Atg22 family)
LTHFMALLGAFLAGFLAKEFLASKSILLN